MNALPGSALPVWYDWRYVVLSYAVAALASYTALDLTGAAAFAGSPRRQQSWIFLSTGALAIGVWSMHFIGMQAFHTVVSLQYDVPVVVASFVLAFAGAMGALWWVVRNNAARRAVIPASILLGVCLAGMHYTGMAALAVHAHIVYDARWVALSVVIAIATSYAAFELVGKFAARQELRRFRSKVLAGLTLAVAIVSVHWTGMAGTHFLKTAVPSTSMARAETLSQPVIAIVVALAAMLIFALLSASAFVNIRMTRREHEHEQFRLLADSAPTMVWTLDANGAVTYVNPRFYECTGLSPEQLRGTDFPDLVIHSEDRMAVKSALASSRETRLPYTVEFRLRGGDGAYRWHLANGAPIVENGRVRGWVGSTTDVHDQKQAHMSVAFLDEATQILTLSLNLETTLSRLCAMLLQYAAWCEVQYDDARSTRRSITAGDLSRALDNDVWTTELVIDQTARGRLTIVGRSNETPFSDIERVLFDHLSLRIGKAVSNANLFQREHRVAESFQKASLPTSLPKVPGVQFDAVYVPGRNEATVGGDWYDAVRLLDGRIVISIGDVAGSGLDAAVIMGNVRQIIRGIAQVHADPALMLDAADRALRLEHGDRFVTAFVAVLDPVTQTLAFASAGHPPALVRRPDGTIDRLSDGGLPLGLRSAVQHEAGRTVQLAPGSAICFYTDGLTEASHNTSDGDDMLAKVFEDANVLRRPSPAKTLKEELLGDQDPRDDVAILVVKLQGETRGKSSVVVHRWTVDVADHQAVREHRAEFKSILRGIYATTEENAISEVVLGELIGNCVRYACGVVEIALDLSGSSPVLHVLDNGPGFVHIAMLPADLYAESGRGLYIVSALTQDFRVSRRMNGGSHARAVLPLARRNILNTRPGTLAGAFTR